MDPNATTSNPNQSTSPSLDSPPSVVGLPKPDATATNPAAASTTSSSPLSPSDSLSATSSPNVSPVISPVTSDQNPPKKSKSMLWIIILLVLAFACGLFIAGWYFQFQFLK